MTCARPHVNTTPSEHFLHTSHCMLHICTSHSTLHLISNNLISSRLMSPHLSSSHLIPSLLTCHLSNSSSQLFSSDPSAKKKFISALLQARKLLTNGDNFFAQQKHCAHKAFADRSLRHREFTLRNLNEILCTTKLPQIRPSTTLYHKGGTKSDPVLLCTRKLAQSTSQYYFVLQSLRKERPSTTSYYQAGTKYFPVLLCTTKLAQSTSQYYFVLRSLHKRLPSISLY